MEFEWNSIKNQANLKKHGINFEEAQSVFDDKYAIIIDDRFHSNKEYREIIVGQSLRKHFLYVVFVERGDYIRIISARKLTSAERRRYEKGTFRI
ncbi:BrnT family toxin [Candidatus Magnetomoraceae bacterium gMMP-1]